MLDVGGSLSFGSCGFGAVLPAHIVVISHTGTGGTDSSANTSVAHKENKSLDGSELDVILVKERDNGHLERNMCAIQSIHQSW